MRVYHIVKNELEMAVGAFLQPKTFSLENYGVKKRQIEEELEIVRKDSFPDFPSRLYCLYVCYDIDDVEFWAVQKSSIYGRQFNVLTLETTESVFWFSAESYHMYFNGLRNDLHQACLDFWESNSNTEIEKMEDREGLTNGPAQIIDIQRVRVSRGNGLVVL